MEHGKQKSNLGWFYLMDQMEYQPQNRIEANILLQNLHDEVVHKTFKTRKMYWSNLTSHQVSSNRACTSFFPQANFFDIIAC